MKLLRALTVAINRRVRRTARRSPLLFKGIALALVLCVLETLAHVYMHGIPRPPQDLDEPFARECLDPRLSAASHPREKAAIVMLARNSDRKEARATILNFEAQFNQWFNYPVIILNNEPWDPDFIRDLNASTSGEAIFETIPEKDWTFPSWINPESARQSIAQQGLDGVWQGGQEPYHHMCRFYSGTFYTHPALAPYKWYWRIEPGVHFSCAITYAPFAAMARTSKTYGFTVALWEEPNTCPSLFRAVDDFRRKNNLPKTPTWNALIDSPLPWYLQPYPVRKTLGLLGYAHHARGGERWNLCHYWSNFEIADLDFFRSKTYQALFEHLDQQGGFYHERWGDAPVHSLAVHLLLPPGKLHHFSDFGYQHAPFFQCPGNAPGGQLPENDALETGRDGGWSAESEGAIGCRCKCPDKRRRNNRGICLDTMQAPAAHHRTGWWAKWRGKYPYTVNIPG
jgi:mannosyltransferase